MSDRLDEIVEKAKRLNALGLKPFNKTTEEETAEIDSLFAQGFNWDTWTALKPIMDALDKAQESPADERDGRGSPASE